MVRIRQGPKSNSQRRYSRVRAEPKADSAGTDLRWLYQAAVLFVLVVVGFFVYSNTLKGPFLFDDRRNIEDNPYLRLTSLALGDILAAAFNERCPTRPTANITFALNHYFHRYDVRGYHCTNIAIHLLTGIFLYFFVNRTLGIVPSDRAGNHRQITAFFAALIWLVHPIQVQSVTYIVQRMTSLAGMFYVLSLLCYVEGRVRSLEHKKCWPWLTACVIAATLALGSKESAATLPVFILLYEWYFFRDLKVTWMKRHWPYLMVLFVILGLVGLWYILANPFKGLVVTYEGRGFTPTERLLTQGRVVLFYISLLLYPALSRLSLDHDFVISRSLFEPPATLLCIMAIIAFVALGIYMARKNRLLSFCILWFFGNLVIESSVIGLELAFEHRLYVPSMLAVLAIVLLLERCLRPEWLRIAVFSTLALVCSIWTYQRNRVWNDPVALWRDCVAKSPRQPRPHFNLANCLLKRDKTSEAIEHYKEAIKLKPTLTDAQFYLGRAFFDDKQFGEAIKQYETVLKLRGDYERIHFHLANALGRSGQTDKAIEHYQIALQRAPEDVEVHNNLALALIQKGELDEAIERYNISLRLAPGSAELHYNLANVYKTQRQLDQAIAHYRKALELEGGFKQAHYHLADALTMQGRFDQALEHYNQVLRLDPRSADAYCGLGELFTRLGEFDRTVECYNRAIELQPDNVVAHGRLGLALAGQGKTDQAIEQFRIVLKHRPDDVEMYCNLGFLLERQGKIDEAVKQYRRALQINPNYRKASMLLEAALAKRKNGD